jgi:hypothetical protein
MPANPRVDAEIRTADPVSSLTRTGLQTLLQVLVSLGGFQMWAFRGSAAAAIGLMLGMTNNAAAQASCQTALPAFTAAMRANTAEALTTYLKDHGPCFEAPARSRLDTLGGAVAETPPAAAVEPANPPPAAQVAAVPTVDPSCAQYANARSERWDQPVNFRVTNQTNAELSVAWINYEGQRGEPQIVPVGGTYGGGTFVTHPFEFTGPDGTCVKIIMPQAGVEEYVVGP